MEMEDESERRLLEKPQKCNVTKSTRKQEGGKANKFTL